MKLTGIFFVIRCWIDDDNIEFYNLKFFNAYYTVM